jgi:LPS sulfotransferase NodH
MPLSDHIYTFRRWFMRTIKCSYCIIDRPRSGANLLMDLLAAARIGRSCVPFRSFGDHQSPADLITSLENLIHENSHSGIFGFKATLEDLATLTTEISRISGVMIWGDVRALMPNLRYISIQRDPIERAVSYWRASVTSNWGPATESPLRPAFNASEVKHLIREFLLQDYLVHHFMEGVGASVTTINYSEIFNNPGTTVRKIAAVCEVPNCHENFPEVRGYDDRYTEQLLNELHEDLRATGCYAAPWIVE